jgi:cyclase
VHMGDVFISVGYPFVDADSGGDLDGMIGFIRSVLDELEPDAIVIPGHGPITDYSALARYVEMLTDIRNRIAALIADGATLEQVIAAEPTAAWDGEYGNPAAFIDRAYTSLSR